MRVSAGIVRNGDRKLQLVVLRTYHFFGVCAWLRDKCGTKVTVSALKYPTSTSTCVGTNGSWPWQVLTTVVTFACQTNDKAKQLYHTSTLGSSSAS